MRFWPSRSSHPKMKTVIGSDHPGFELREDLRTYLREQNVEVEDVGVPSETARMSREHNDANVLVLGGPGTGKGLAREVLKVWLESRFQGGNHQRRMEKVKSLEGKIQRCGQK